MGEAPAVSANRLERGSASAWCPSGQHPPATQPPGSSHWLPSTGPVRLASQSRAATVALQDGGFQSTASHISAAESDLRSSPCRLKRKSPRLTESRGVELPKHDIFILFVCFVKPAQLLTPVFVVSWSEEPPGGCL